MNPIRNPIKRKPNCRGKADQYLSNEYDTKIIQVKCGTTDIDGSTLICNKCSEEWILKYPNGLYDVYGSDDDYNDSIN